MVINVQDHGAANAGKLSNVELEFTNFKRFNLAELCDVKECFLADLQHFKKETYAAIIHNGNEQDKHQLITNLEDKIILLRNEFKNKDTIIYNIITIKQIQYTQEDKIKKNFKQYSKNSNHKSNTNHTDLFANLG